MNEHEIADLLNKLAQKLGTTADKLWQILLVQARISATMSLIFILFMVISGFVIYRFHIKFNKVIEGDKREWNFYEKSDSASIIMGVCSVLWGIGLICSYWVLQNIITGYFNPEYWAFNEIIEAIK